MTKEKGGQGSGAKKNDGNSTCALCELTVELESEHMLVECKLCGATAYHVECIDTYIKAGKGRRFFPTHCRKRDKERKANRVLDSQWYCPKKFAKAGSLCEGCVEKTTRIKTKKELHVWGGQQRDTTPPLIKRPTPRCHAESTPARQAPRRDRESKTRLIASTRITKPSGDRPKRPTAGKVAAPPFSRFAASSFGPSRRSGRSSKNSKSKKNTRKVDYRANKRVDNWSENDEVFAEELQNVNVGESGVKPMSPRTALKVKTGGADVKREWRPVQKSETSEWQVVSKKQAKPKPTASPTRPVEPTPKRPEIPESKTVNAKTPEPPNADEKVAAKNEVVDETWNWADIVRRRKVSRATEPWETSKGAASPPRRRHETASKTGANFGDLRLANTNVAPECRNDVGSSMFGGEKLMARKKEAEKVWGASKPVSRRILSPPKDRPGPFCAVNAKRAKHEGGGGAFSDWLNSPPGTGFGQSNSESQTSPSQGTKKGVFEIGPDGTPVREESSTMGKQTVPQIPPLLNPAYEPSKTEALSTGLTQKAMERLSRPRASHAPPTCREGHPFFMPNAPDPANLPPAGNRVPVKRATTTRNIADLLPDSLYPDSDDDESIFWGSQVAVGPATPFGPVRQASPGISFGEGQKLAQARISQPSHSSSKFTGQQDKPRSKLSKTTTMGNDEAGDCGGCLHDLGWDVAHETKQPLVKKALSGVKNSADGSGLLCTIAECQALPVAIPRPVPLPEKAAFEDIHDVVLSASSREEVEAACNGGFLPLNYRTVFCSSVGYGSCPVGPNCIHAHSAKEFRFEAAMKLAEMSPGNESFPAPPKDYKTKVCLHWWRSLANEKNKLSSKGRCPYGERCCWAHSSKEFRVLPMIKQYKRLQSQYKTRPCPHYNNDKTCPDGPLCLNAHGFEEMRKEAMILVGMRKNDFKTKLCAKAMRGETCIVGNYCNDAHSVEDLRLAAAVREKYLGVLSKTGKKMNVLLKTIKCRRMSERHDHVKCCFFHSHLDYLRPVVYSMTLCPTWKELGNCSVKNCPFAHKMEELRFQSESDWDKVAAPVFRPTDHQIRDHTLAFLKHHKLRQCVLYAQTDFQYSLLDADRISQHAGGDKKEALKTFLNLQVANIRDTLKGTKDIGVEEEVAQVLALVTDMTTLGDVEKMVVFFEGDVDRAGRILRERESVLNKLPIIQFGRKKVDVRA